MSWDNSYSQRTKTLEEKFWEKVDKKDEDECWEWQASRNYKGYGIFYTTINKNKKKGHGAHRVAYMLHFRLNDLLSDIQVCHICDNPACCNPNHLWLGTNRDNQLDSMKKGRHKVPLGEDHGKSKLSNKDVLKIRKMRKKGYTFKFIAEKFNITSANVGYITKRKTWKHI